jgi:hypothetical protein
VDRLAIAFLLLVACRTEPSADIPIPPRSARDLPPLVAAVREDTPTGARQCGRTKESDPASLNSVSKCIIEARRERAPFVAFEEYNCMEGCERAFVGSAAGDVWIYEYDHHGEFDRGFCASTDVNLAGGLPRCFKALTDIEDLRKRPN